jgi:2'-5' RNA ligase
VLNWRDELANGTVDLLALELRRGAEYLGSVRLPPDSTDFILEQVGSTEAEIRTAVERYLKGYKYSSTQVNLPEDAAEVVRQLGQRIDPADLTKDGREDTPHVTVRYGLWDESPANAIPLIQSAGVLRYTLGDITLFENDEFDVLKISVDSPDLTALNEKLKALDHTDTYPGYHPHVTIAYLKPGTGKKYVPAPHALWGKTFTSNVVLFSSRTGDKTLVSTTGELLKVAIGNGNNQYKQDRPTKTSKGEAILHAIIDSGVGSDYVHALYDDDPADTFAYLGIEGIRDADVEYAKAEVKQRSQSVLRQQFGEEFTAYRGRTGREGKGSTVSLTLKKTTAIGHATKWGSKPGGLVDTLIVRTADVLAYSEAIGKGTFAEEEIIVPSEKLKTLAAELNPLHRAADDHLEPLYDLLAGAFKRAQKRLSLSEIESVLKLRTAIGNGNNQYRQDRPTKGDKPASRATLAKLTNGADDLTLEENKALMREFVETYKEDPDMRGAADVVAQYSQLDQPTGLFTRAVVAAAAEGKTPEEILASPKVQKLLAAANEHRSEKLGEAEVRTLAAGSAGYHNLLREVEPTDTKVYRGVARLPKGEAGEEFELRGPTAFSHQLDAAMTYSTGGLIEVLPGAKMLPVQALSNIREAAADPNYAEHATLPAFYGRKDKSVHPRGSGWGFAIDFDSDRELNSSGRFKIVERTDKRILFRDGKSGRERLKTVKILRIQQVGVF